MVSSTSANTRMASNASKHNLPIHSWMNYSFLGFLFVGLLISSGIQHVKNIRTAGTSTEVENFYPHNYNLWKPVHHHSDISVYESFENKNSTRPLYHFEYDTNIPLEAFIDVLDHPNQSMEWIAWIKDYKYIGVRKSELDTLDILKTPVNAQMILHPLIYTHEREFLTKIESTMYTAKLENHEEVTTVKFDYSNLNSVNEIKNAFTKQCKDCIRGNLNMLLTLITFDEGESTKLIMDLDMDLQSSDHVPTFVDNSMILKWGEISLHKLMKRCRDNYKLKNIVDVKGGLLNLFQPVKH